MLALFTAILGFAGPFLPELLKVWNRKLDQAHELAMLALQMQMAEAQHAYKMDELGAQADMQEMTVIRQPQQLFGVSLIDAAAKDGWSKWLIAPVFYLFAALDFISGLVRPAITYCAFGFYMATKWAMWDLATRNGIDKASAILTIWTPDDLAVLTLVLGFWFGARTVKGVFGGSASSVSRA